MVDRPPSQLEWVIDGLEHGGHTVAETIAWASWTADYADEVAQQRAAPVNYFSPAVEREPGPVRRWLRRLTTPA